MSTSSDQSVPSRADCIEDAAEIYADAIERIEREDEATPAERTTGVA